MKSFLAVFIILLPAFAHGDATSAYRISDAEGEVPPAGVQASVEAATKYIYNVYYDFLRSVNDGALQVKPRLDASTKPHSVSFDASLDGNYEQYFTQTIQNHFDYDGKATMYVNKGGATEWHLSGGYDSFSDPSPTETFGRVPRTITDGELGAKFKTAKGNSVNFSARGYSESFNVPNLLSGNYLDNQGVDVSVEYKNAFLPETSWLLRASGGFRTFPNKTILDTGYTALLPKNDSDYVLLETGFEGRLSDKSSVDSAIGWLVRVYSTDTEALNPLNTSDNYSDPVFYMRFLEQITRSDQFEVGYNYQVMDSYYTNYYLDQEIYIGIVRVIGDQLLFLTRLAYDYRTFSLPSRRDDERITASASMKYSLSKNVKLTADLGIDLLSSDAYDNEPDPTLLISPDRPASYNAGTFALGVEATF